MGYKEFKEILFFYECPAFIASSIWWHRVLWLVHYHAIQGDTVLSLYPVLLCHSVQWCRDAHGFMGVNAGWKLCKLRRLLNSSKTSWSYRRWKITRNSIKFWLIIPGELPSIFLYIHVESINLKTKPVKIVQSHNEFIERQGKRSWNVPSWREDWGT